MNFSPAFMSMFPVLKELQSDPDICAKLFCICLSGGKSQIYEILSNSSYNEVIVSIISLYERISICKPRVDTKTTTDNFDAYAVLKSTKIGSIICIKCKSDSVTYILRQTRSADEGMTCMCFCNNCRSNFVL